MYGVLCTCKRKWTKKTPSGCKCYAHLVISRDFLLKQSGSPLLELICNGDHLSFAVCENRRQKIRKRRYIIRNSTASTSSTHVLGLFTLIPRIHTISEEEGQTTWFTFSDVERVKSVVRDAVSCFCPSCTTKISSQESSAECRSVILQPV